MIVKTIYTSDRFKKEFQKLPEKTQKIALKQETLFRSNPLHRSLRFHQLHGKLEGFCSISVAINYRILLIRQHNGDILFFSIGTHDIYRSV